MAAPEPDRCLYDPDEYRFTWNESGIELVFSRFREERGELKATVQPFALDGKGNLPRGNVSVGLGRSMSLLAGQFAEWHALIKKPEWEDLIKKGCEYAEKRYREGEPPVVLAEVDWQQLSSFVHEPFVDAHGTTILFGDGGVSKSVHALAIAASVASGQAIIGELPAVTGPVTISTGRPTLRPTRSAWRPSVRATGCRCRPTSSTCTGSPPYTRACASCGWPAPHTRT